MLQALRRRRNRVPQGQNAKPFSAPAPIGGVNAISGLMEFPEKQALVMENLIPGQYGCRVREGSIEWANAIDGDEVRTVIPYKGTAADGSDDRLFACTKTDIYDITASGASPSSVLTFGSAVDTTGWGSWTTITTTAGKFILYCDEANGYHVYAESTDSWAAIAMGGGGSEVATGDPTDFVFVLLWKERVWFVERDSAKAWYLAAGAIYGTAASFNFGNKFRTGGNLVGLYSWTVDGGVGVDDYLVAVSSTGDVVVYKGTDPTSADSFAIQGQWFIGAPPVGRRIAGSIGGELHLLSSYGLISVPKLLRGVDVGDTDAYLTANISPLIKSYMDLSRTMYGWEVKFFPSKKIVMVSTPKLESYPYIQFVQDTDTKGWAVFSGLPYLTGEEWQNQVYFGTDDERVMQNSGYLDEVLLAGGTPENVEWRLQTSFTDFGVTGFNKRPAFLRPIFIGESAPAYVAEIKFDYDISDTSYDSGTPEALEASWDSGVWDSSVWASDTVVTKEQGGATGMGRVFSVRLRGASRAKCTLIGFEGSADSGGLL